MISFDRAIVNGIREEEDKISWITVELNGKTQKAVNYNDITGKIKVGDRVVLNTTAVNLSLGTGGEHFVISNLENKNQELKGDGHIMKLRYTPMQLKCLSTEEQDSPYHDTVKSFESLGGKKFIVGTLHSMVGPIAAHIKKNNPSLKINYIMTDGGALPIDFSKTVTKLKSIGLIENTITVGQSFGGDYEAINIYTALIIASELLDGDINIIAMGPGIAGTGTKYGFSGIEQGYISDAISNLGGRPILIPRISFADKRDRHRGISHHSLTIFSELVCKSSEIPLPKLEDQKMEIIRSQIERLEIDKKHKLCYKSVGSIDKSMEKYGLAIKTMGRGFAEDPDFFKALEAVANYSMDE